MALLFDFLLSTVKQRIVEELAHGDLQPVADLFDGDDAGILALLVEHTYPEGSVTPYTYTSTTGSTTPQYGVVGGEYVQLTRNQTTAYPYTQRYRYTESTSTRNGNYYIVENRQSRGGIDRHARGIRYRKRRELCADQS